MSAIKKKKARQLRDIRKPGIGKHVAVLSDPGRPH